MMNVELARFNMVEQQIRPWDVLDDRVLQAIVDLPREDFVPENARSLAFADMDIPIGHNEVMMPPKLEARLLQALSLQEDDTVLEIGTGTGFVTALLATLSKHVYSVDIYADFVAEAREKLARHNIKNVTLETGDASKGWSAHGPYDAIFISGALPILPDEFKHSLKIGGRMVAITGLPPVMEAVVITRTGENAWGQESLFETQVPILRNAEVPKRFEF